MSDARNGRQWTSASESETLDAQDRALAVGRDADRDQHGTIDDAAAVADFFVAGIEDQVRCRAQRPIAPDFQLGIEQLGRPADLHAGHVAAAELAGDLGHFAGGDALHVHLGQGQLQGPLATFAAFERRRVELDAAGLGHLQVQLAEAAGDGLGLEAVGIAASRLGALVRTGAQHCGAFELHGFVEQGFECLSHAFESVLGQEVDNFVAGVRLIVVGHGGELLSFCVENKIKRKPPWPTPFKLVAACGAWLRFGSLALASAPPSPTREYLECCLQKKRYTNRSQPIPSPIDLRRRQERQ